MFLCAYSTYFISVKKYFYYMVDMFSDNGFQTHSVGICLFVGVAFMHSLHKLANSRKGCV